MLASAALALALEMVVPAPALGTAVPKNLGNLGI